MQQQPQQQPQTQRRCRRPSPRSVLSLHGLAASCASIKRSCVLGFSRDGDHLLGYSRDADDAEQGGYIYALRVWRVGLSGKASEVLCARLFTEASFAEDTSELTSAAGEGMVVIV
eukprot:COSAG06_NODE_46678_length_345_cov_0.630081_1_plen_114_part_11